MKTTVILSVLAISMISAGAFAQQAAEAVGSAAQKASEVGQAAGAVGANAAETAGFFGGVSQAYQRTADQLTGGKAALNNTLAATTSCGNTGLSPAEIAIVNEGVALGVADTAECMEQKFGPDTKHIAVAGLGGFIEGSHHHNIANMSDADIKAGQEGEAIGLQKGEAEAGSQVTLAQAQGMVHAECNVPGHFCITGAKACKGQIDSAE
jgi:hypothetical protein